MTPDEEKIYSIVRGPIEDLGFRPVCVRIINTGRQTLQIMAEPMDGSVMTVEACAEISQNISPIIDVEDPIKAAYILEVSSPGIDRPLVSRSDFARWAKFEFKLSTRDAIDGRRHFRGMLDGFDVVTDTVRLTLDGTKLAIPYEEISSAKLVLTDALIEFCEQKYGSAGMSAETGTKDELNLRSLNKR